MTEERRNKLSISLCILMIFFLVMNDLVTKKTITMGTLGLIVLLPSSMIILSLIELRKEKKEKEKDSDL